MKKLKRIICLLLCVTILESSIGANAAVLYTPIITVTKYSTGHKTTFKTTYNTTGTQVKVSAKVRVKRNGLYTTTSVSQVEYNTNTACATWYDTSATYEGYTEISSSITIGGKSYSYTE